MNFFDTNILIAATQPTHVHHRECHALLVVLRHTGACCAAHTLSEAFSVLTRMPPPHRLTPLEGLAVVDGTSAFCTLISLTPDESHAAIRSLAQKNLAGGMVYDALLLACARKAGAERIYQEREAFPPDCPRPGRPHTGTVDSASHKGAVLVHHP